MGLGAVAAPLIGSLIGSVFTSLVGGNKQQQAAAPAQQAPAPASAPAPAQSPSIGAFKDANVSASSGGINGTSLSGVGGIDPSILKLGKNTLLGS